MKKEEGSGSPLNREDEEMLVIESRNSIRRFFVFRKGVHYIVDYTEHPLFHAGEIQVAYDGINEEVPKYIKAEIALAMLKGGFMREASK